MFVRALSHVLHDMRFIFSHPRWIWVFPSGSAGKESACNARDPGQIPGLGGSPWRREWPPPPVFLPGESLGQRKLACSSPWGHKVRQDWVRFISLLGEYSWFLWVFDINGYFYLYCKSNKYTLVVRKPYPSQIRNVWRKGEFSCLHSHFTADTLYMLQIRGGGGSFGV